jgi:hypothetical protein
MWVLGRQRRKTAEGAGANWTNELVDPSAWQYAGSAMPSTDSEGFTMSSGRSINEVESNPVTNFD